MPLPPLPHATRSDVYTALFNLLLTLPAPTGETWNTTSQMVQHWEDVAPANQPALFLHRTVQISSQQHAYGISKQEWKCLVWIYYRVDGLKTKNFYPDQLTDQFLDAIEQLFLPSPAGQPQTLGGLVKTVFVDGQCTFDSGLLDGQAVLVCPITLFI
jgi:hypothetical protein